MPHPVYQRIKQCGIIAVIRLDNLSAAVPLSQALVAGGVTIIEFTLTSPNAPAAIAEVKDILGDQCVVGAGSVITVEQVDEVRSAGAAFVVSPVKSQPVVEHCLAHSLPVMPGAYTPSEIQTAWEMGATAVKVFPARDLGPRYIKDVLAPLPHLQLIPTGGINASNAAAYIRAGVAAIGVGGSLVDGASIAAEDWDTIQARARALVEAVGEARTHAL
jgi:2-dehydro-3-deoxyphosphogluconate aldolase / (4S)-4-hydroxy-2-oxoglutarate aldolase